MNREEILAMDSTELRIEVAEKIFHAKVIGKDGSNPPEFLLVGDKGAGWMPLSGKRWQSAEWYFSEEAAWNDCPEYGESISAAWEVMDKFDDITVNRYKNIDGEYRVSCHIKKSLFKQFDSNEETAPLAICRCALLAAEG